MSKKLSGNQKAFNKVARHLLKQGCKSLQPVTSFCAYRGMNKTRCAIGALIPNRLYSKNLEDSTPFCENVGGILRSLGYLDVEFNCSLQKIHDSVSPNRWRRELEKLAEENNLVWPKGL